MPRANRHALPGHVWHLTHRCHRQQFLLKFVRDRRVWRRWLFEARKRYDLCVLDFMVTSNHIHLLVQDRGHGEIAKSMQLIAGRTAQAYNQRKQRGGAYWEDRYHATAVEVATHLTRCMTYIDLNMVRAGAVSHPGEWEVCGYREIQHPPARYRVIDYAALMELLSASSLGQLQQAHRHWTDEALQKASSRCDEHWSRSLAIGSRRFVTQFQTELGAAARHRDIHEHGASHVLREEPAPYTAVLDGKAAHPGAENTIFLDVSV